MRHYTWFFAISVPLYDAFTPKLGEVAWLLLRSWWYRRWIRDRLLLLLLGSCTASIIVPTSVVIVPEQYPLSRLNGTPKEDPMCEQQMQAAIFLSVLRQEIAQK